MCGSFLTFQYNSLFQCQAFFYENQSVWGGGGAFSLFILEKDIMCMLHMWRSPIDRGGHTHHIYASLPPPPDFSSNYVHECILVLFSFSCVAYIRFFPLGVEKLSHFLIRRRSPPPPPPRVVISSSTSDIVILYYTTLSQ